MRRRLLTILSIALVVGALAAPPAGPKLSFARTNGEVGTSGHIYLNNSSGTYRGRQFAAPGGGRAGSWCWP